mgnify:CR=1 FL=1
MWTRGSAVTLARALRVSRAGTPSAGAGPKQVVRSRAEDKNAPSSGTQPMAMPFLLRPLRDQLLELEPEDEDDDDDLLALALGAELDAVLDDHATEVDDHDLGFAASAAWLLVADAVVFLAWWRRCPFLLLPEQAAETTEAARSGVTRVVKSMVKGR